MSINIVPHNASGVCELDRILPRTLRGYMKVRRKIRKDVFDRATKAWELRYKRWSQQTIAEELHVGLRMVQKYHDLKWLEEGEISHIADLKYHQPQIEELTEGRIREIIEMIRLCLHYSRSDMEAQEESSGFLLPVGGHDWVLAPHRWVQLTTPDFQNSDASPWRVDHPWGEDYPIWRVHKLFTNFFAYLGELKEMADALNEKMDDRAMILGESEPKFLIRWNYIRDQVDWTPEVTRTPQYPEPEWGPDWAAIHMPYEDTDAAEMCRLLSQRHFRDLYLQVAALDAKLIQINQELDKMLASAGQYSAGVPEAQTPAP